MVKLKLKINPEWLILALFVFGALFYASLDGLPLTHPGNLKAADPFYHAMITEGILDAKQWNHYPEYLALGQTTAMNSQPPLLYIQSAVISALSTIPSWASTYFLVALFAALSIAIMFLLVREVFDNTQIALLSAFAVVIPVASRAWLYPVYIGFWIQVVAYAFILAFVWLAIRYWKTSENWCLWIINLCIAVVILTHPQDLLVLFIPWLGIVWLIWKKNHMWKKRWQAFIALASISAVLFVILLPRFLVIWPLGEPAIGWYGLQETFFDRSYIGGLTTPDLFFLPWWILAFAAVGLLGMLRQPKKYMPWLVTLGFFFLVTYGFPMFIKGISYYLSGRTRALTPFFILPTAAFFLVHGVLKPIERRFRIPTVLLVLVLGLASLGYGFMESKDMRQGLAYEHLAVDKWQVFQWVHDNVPDDAKIFVLEGTGQNVHIFLKRNAALVSPNVMQANAEQILRTQTFPLEWDVEWAAETLRHTHYKQTGFLTFKKYEEWPRTVTITDFDYIMFEDLSPDVGQFNLLVIQLLAEQGYQPVYREGRFTIIEKGAS